jgi:predicted ATPase
MIRITFLLICLALISCEKDSKNEEEKQEPDPEKIKKSEKNVSERFLRIDGTLDTLRQFELGKDLFGKFFSERAEFYIIENPNKTIYNHPVKSITLYFLDGKLSKTKYELDADISDDLIHSYGTFTIKGYDSITRRLFKTEKIVDRVNDKKILNKNLVNYELKWEMSSKFIYTRVDKSGPKARYEYIESLKNYDAKFKGVERAF